MIKLGFNCLKLKNFLCFGPEGIELYFHEYGNIINVVGQDIDQDPPRSNGSGKSSIFEGIVYALYGRTIKNAKKIKHGDVINNKTRKKLCVEIQWDDYRIVRKLKPNSLRFWKSKEKIWNKNTELTVGGSKTGTQKKINEALGLNYDTFINLIIFTDNNAGCFLECETPEKRKIIENLLSLEKYRKYAEIAKDSRKEIADNVNVMLKEYDILSSDQILAKDRIVHIEKQKIEWRNNLKEEIKLLMERIKIKKKELESTDEGMALAAWQNAQNEVARINKERAKQEGNKEKLNTILQEASDKLHLTKEAKHSINIQGQDHLKNIKDAEAKIDEKEELIESLEKNRGNRCPLCYSTIKEENYNDVVIQSQEEISQNNQLIGDEKLQLEILNNDLATKKKLISKLEEGIDTIREKLTSINREIMDLNEDITPYTKVPRPDVDAAHLVLEKGIEELKKQALAKKKDFEGPTPFSEILVKAKEELEDKIKQCEDKKEEIDGLREELPYYDFWVKAFGDTGIRKFIVDGVISPLNNRLAYWLEYLTEGMIQIEFDNELNETIQRNPADGDPFVYHAMSGGERRMLNLAVSQAFAHVMMLSSGTRPSFTFLDEVGSNIDTVGKEGIYKLICELAKDKQVFVTTHDPYLLDLLKRHDEIRVEKKDGFTTLI
jgi:DNA repair exonuclease SbcCD ATPase subunit